MSRNASRAIPEVVVEVEGKVPTDAARQVRLMVRALANHTDQPILFARARLIRQADPAVARPFIAQGNLDLDGRPVRAQVAGETMRQAVDGMQDRLRERLDRLALDWEARRGAVPTSRQQSWRRGGEPVHRPGFYPRPPAEREIVRHKSFALAVETPDEAAFELESMDYDFHLFTDLETGLDSVIYRAGPAGYRLARPGQRIEPPAATAVPLSVSSQPVPRLEVPEAVERLELTGWPFVFFVNPETGRGNLLYHRYDGHYGLITPAG